MADYENTKICLHDTRILSMYVKHNAISKRGETQKSNVFKTSCYQKNHNTV